MILTCERCETRFRLDESRLPARGARVRCSRCKHAFFVQPPGATQAAAIDEIAQQAAASARPATPEASWDLDEADAGSTLQRAAPVAEPPSEFEDENDWRFEDELPQLGDTGASLDLPNGEAPPPSAADRNESSFAELGDPESWNLVANADDTTAARHAPIAPLEVTAPPQPERVAAPTPLREEQGIAATPVVRAPVEPGFALRAAGWIATAALVLAVAAGSIRSLPSPRTGALGHVRVGPLELELRSARLVENALVGSIWVVSGDLINATSEARALESAIGVALLDVDGHPIDGAVAMVRPSIAAERLRDEDPVRLLDEAGSAGASLAFQLVEPGARVPVDAVFASAPRGAAQVAVAAHPVRRPDAHAATID